MHIYKCRLLTQSNNSEDVLSHSHCLLIINCFSTAFLLASRLSREPDMTINMSNLVCLYDSDAHVVDIETYNLGNVLRNSVSQWCSFSCPVSFNLDSSAMKRLQLTDPSLHACTAKIQNYQNHLRAREKYLCTKLWYRKPSDNLFYKHSENIPRRVSILVSSCSVVQGQTLKQTHGC